MDLKAPIRWRIFALLFSFGFLAYMQQKTITVAAERIMPDRHLSQVQIGFLEQAFVAPRLVYPATRS
jgi:sugar phosphate permease